MFKKITNKYYFSVEGQTEQWYLKWLAAKINEAPEIRYKIAIDSKIQNNPFKRVKSMNILSRTEITHWVDYESNEESHVTEFKNTLDSLKKVCNIGKQVEYHLGYSNLTFELWMILHKTECNSMLTHRRQYLELINSAYGKKFNSLRQFKQEHNFKKCLERIELSDVINAVNRSRCIMERNAENKTLCQHKGYKYYTDNPSLSVWESIEKILVDCNLMQLVD